MMEGALSRQTAERLIEAATAAPSMHNSQPWRFVARLADRVIEVYADPSRTLRRGDPRGRAVHLACGSALFNLRLAIAQSGCEPVARLLPSPRDPLLLASVRLAGPYRARPAERDLYAAIRDSRSRRVPYPRQPLPRGLQAALAEAAALEGASLRLLDQADALRILRRSAAADPDLASDPGYLAELAAWTGGLRHSQPGRSGPRPAPGPGSGRPVAGQRPAGDAVGMRDIAAGPAGSPRLRPLSDTGPQLAVVSISSDDRASWLRAGQATQRVLLLASHRGLQATALSPVLDMPEPPLRAEPVLAGEHPAMILRLGFGQPGPAMSRRPVSQVTRVIPSPSLRQPAGAAQDKGPSEGPPPALAPVIAS
jgi:nitroreductase